ITPERLYDAVHVLLTYQNADGGWATYENNRGYRFYEWLNPCETFGDIMIDYSYVELSSASMTALAAFQRDHPSHRTSDIAGALKRGAKFIKTIQRSDGSWYGSWAVCFTYGTWFGIEALKCAGQLDCASVRRGVAFLISKQESTGGWGETIRSCLDKNYDSTPEASFGQGSSGVVQTAWAVLALMAAEVSAPAEVAAVERGVKFLMSRQLPSGDCAVAAVERGVKFLMSRQLPSGDWPQEGITGVFNRSCGITYTSYRTVFPIWALARHAHWRKTLAA
ncbi:terpenoid cyclases/protein prenyltransferase alpha-alpha toroid, partial [Baffinella frigidus]